MHVRVVEFAVSNYLVCVASETLPLLSLHLNDSSLVWYEKNRPSRCAGSRVESQGDEGAQSARKLRSKTNPVVARCGDEWMSGINVLTRLWIDDLLARRCM